MTIRRSGPVLKGLSTLFHLGNTGELTDGQLLERFATRDDGAAELAFAALIERHGPLVLHVCRSVLRDDHEADDAFQATFLVLVGKTRSLWVADSLAPWLHAVARRVALAARSSAARRREQDGIGAGGVASEVGAVSAHVAALTRGVLMGFTWHKLKVGAVCLLATALVAGVGGVAARARGGGQAGGPAAVAPRAANAADEPPRERPGRIFLTDGRKDGRLIAVDPGTGDQEVLAEGLETRPRISPDGWDAAFTREGSLWVLRLSAGAEPRRVLDLGEAAFGTPPVWSHDGKEIVASLARRDEARQIWLFRTVRLDVAGARKEELKVPPEDGVQDWSPDGQWLLTTSSRNARIGWQLYIMRPDGTDQRQVTDGGNPFYARFSPDGRRVVYSDGTTEERRGIWTVGVDGKDRRRVTATGDALASACWSPDGKRLAVMLFDSGPATQNLNGRLVLMDLDGEHRTVIPLPGVIKADMPDWR